MSCIRSSALASPYQDLHAVQECISKSISCLLKLMWVSVSSAINHRKHRVPYGQGTIIWRMGSLGDPSLGKFSARPVFHFWRIERSLLSLCFHAIQKTFSRCYSDSIAQYVNKPQHKKTSKFQSYLPCITKGLLAKDSCQQRFIIVANNEELRSLWGRISWHDITSLWIISLWFRDTLVSCRFHSLRCSTEKEFLTTMSPSSRSKIIVTCMSQLSLPLNPKY